MMKTSEDSDLSHDGPDDEALQHPGPKEYIRIGLILALITAIEVGVYYVPSLRPLIVPILLVLSLIKFSLVVLWFMHLKFDSRLFRRLLVGGIVLAIGVYSVVLVTLVFKVSQ